MEITVSWESGGKRVEVKVDCQTATKNWAKDCAKKVREAVEAMEEVFPPDKKDGEKSAQRGE